MEPFAIRLRMDDVELVPPIVEIDQCRVVPENAELPNGEVERSSPDAEQLVATPVRPSSAEAVAGRPSLFQSVVGSPENIERVCYLSPRIIQKLVAEDYDTISV